MSTASTRGLLKRLDPQEPAMFVWEGVTQYLPPDSVDVVLSVIRAQARGCELVFT
jgi:O-methyltransferase involved in polyketide biosynthesis